MILLSCHRCESRSWHYRSVLGGWQQVSSGRRATAQSLPLLAMSVWSPGPFVMQLRSPQLQPWGSRLPTAEPATRREARAEAGPTREASSQAAATVVTVFSAKGGCGKTTLATNLAAVLADGGRSDVCLLDLDLAFGDVAVALHLIPARTIADTVQPSPALDAALIRSLLSVHSPGLKALAAPTRPEIAETIDSELVGNVLRLLRAQADYVVIDTPPAFDDHVIEALSQSDLVTLVATPHGAALQQLRTTLSTLDLLGHPRERRRAVLNRVRARDGSIRRGQLQAAVPMPISAFIPASREVPASINRGQPFSPRGSGPPGQQGHP